MTGISYARFSTEAIVILEFSQAPHHMQPRVHELVNQVLFRCCCAIMSMMLGNCPQPGL